MRKKTLNESLEKGNLGGSWSLGGLREVLDRQYEQREKERLEWQAQLGEPFDSVAGFDFFRVEGGVFMIEKRKNGYHWQDVRQFSDEMVEAFAKAKNIPPTPPEKL